MSSNEDSRYASAAQSFARSLNEAHDRMKRAKSRARFHYLVSNDIPTRLHVELENAVLDMWEELRPFRQESDKFADRWEDADLDRLPQRCGRPVQRKVTRSGWGQKSARTVTDIEHANPEYLFHVARIFDDLANTLGFTPNISESTQYVKITDEMLEEVEQWEQRHER